MLRKNDRQQRIWTRLSEQITDPDDYAKFDRIRIAVDRYNLRDLTPGQWRLIYAIHDREQRRWAAIVASVEENFGDA